MPAAAFEESRREPPRAGRRRGCGGGERATTRGTLAPMLARTSRRIAFLRFPQIPSSRAFGDAPAVTTWEYQVAIPADPAEAQIVPVPPRAFPAALRDPDLLPQRPPHSEQAAAFWGIVSIVGIPWVLRTAWRRWRSRA